jgi:alkaline phosphatase D
VAKVDRRRFLRLAGGAAAGVAAAEQLPARGAATTAAAEPDPGPFSLGVASGDPASDSVVLWTRLAPDPLVPGGGMPPEPVPVRWEVAHDERFRHVVRSGQAVAEPRRPARWTSSAAYTRSTRRHPTCAPRTPRSRSSPPGTTTR